MTDGSLTPSKSPERKAFEHYLRTGRRISPEEDCASIEVKFNPWHDPENGRFTFSGRGRYLPFGSSGSSANNSKPPSGTGPGQQRLQSSARAAGRASRQQAALSRFDPHHPTNHSEYHVQPGDTLTAIANRRRGLRTSDLAMLNGLPNDARLRTGQRLIVPNQSYLDAGKAARANFVNLAFYRDTHGGKLPPNPAKAPSIQTQLDSDFTTRVANNYNFDIDVIHRPRRIYGYLQSGQPEKRSRTLQRQAGGADRLPGDDGGHYIAARFRGPREAFNHFAQDANFNRGGYRVIEDSWAKAQAEGQRVKIDITPYYRGASQRPYALTVKWTIDGKTGWQDFGNQAKRK